MLPSFATQTVTVISPTYIEDHGNQIPNWASTTETDVSGCSVQPGVTEEDLQNRDSFLIQWTVYAPAGTAVTALSRVRYAGVVYTVAGAPQVWGVGILDHVKILLKRWEG